MHTGTMKSFHFYRLLIETYQSSLKRSLHSGYVLLARQRRKMVDYTMREPGIQRRKELYADVDLPDLESDFDDGNFIEEEALNVENLDEFYDADQREKRDYRKAERKRITYDRYFALPKQPAMLTTNELDCIKYLHKNDPINWDVNSLSESFPAVPETIRKILRAKYKITPERAKKRDENVYKNWDLLAQGKLEADPVVIEHCRKFINRREILLEQIKNSKFYLPEVKEEVTYNCGEMSKILGHYEKRLEELQKERDQNMLLEEAQPKKEAKEYIELLHEEVQKVMSKRTGKKETASLRKMVNKYAKEITFEGLERKIIEKVEKNKKTDLAEKAILELKFGSRKQYTDPVEKETMKVKPKLIPEKMLAEDTSLRLETESEDYRMDTFEDDLPDLPSPDERTRFTRELGVGQLLNEIKNPVEPETKKVADMNDVPDPETIAREEEHFDKQVEDIKNTSFWNNSLQSEEKSKLEMLKNPVEVPTECTRITKSEVKKSNEYPLRIPIPKSKRGSGLTFRVKDCFYDDDGQFLYRVPGLFREDANS